MAYLFLTGATGLLGRYLLRDAVSAGLSVAVLARGARAASARERVDAALRTWEETAGRRLPRPVVLEGTLGRPELGLSGEQYDWLADHCWSVLHCAASIRFHADRPGDDPFRTNVDGTARLLDLCRQLGLRRFHHVSTAYVCGTRAGRILENEFDAGQAFGNDYERSKFESERLVRDSTFLGPPTIYRPSIIVGDSESGYSSTFHGVYTPLRIMWERRRDDPAGGEETCTALLGLRGDERKNVVAVDWVSAVILHVLNDQALHGRTYHLTNPRPVRVADLEYGFASVFSDRRSAFQGTRSRREAVGPIAVANRADELADGMSVYRAYLRDDPEFDSAHTQAAAPHLPCPDMDQGRLTILASYAVRTNFGWPPTPVPRLEFDLERLLHDRAGRRTPSHGTNEVTYRIQLDLWGAGGGAWALEFSGEDLTSVAPGVAPPHDALASGTADAFAAVLGGQATLEQALYSGSIVLEAEGGRLDGAVRLLGSLSESARTVLEPPAAGSYRERETGARSRHSRASV